MLNNLWQAIWHGKQGRTQTRNQEAQEKARAEAPRDSSSGARRQQTARTEALTPGLAAKAAGLRIMTNSFSPRLLPKILNKTFRLATALLLMVICALATPGQAPPNGTKAVWKSVPFAILRYNDEAPKSWGMYHTEKRGLLLVRLWKRYLLINLNEQEVFDIDPLTVKLIGENVEWTVPDSPENPVEISEWKQRDVGGVERIRFRFGKDGHFFEMQIPLRPDGKPLY